jgi:hypothetical protein
MIEAPSTVKEVKTDGGRGLGRRGLGGRLGRRGRRMVTFPE